MKRPFNLRRECRRCKNYFDDRRVAFSFGPYCEKCTLKIFIRSNAEKTEYQDFNKKHFINAILNIRNVVKCLLD